MHFTLDLLLKQFTNRPTFDKWLTKPLFLNLNLTDPNDPFHASKY